MNETKIIVLLVLGWFLIFSIWIITDPRPLRQAFKKSILKIYAIVAIILILQILGSLLFPVPVNQSTHFVMFLGALLYIFGALFATWAKLTMKSFWGPPGEHDSKRQNKLVVSGPFSISRNPIYVGNMLMVFGFSLVLRSIMAFLVIFLFLYFYKTVVIKEKLLEKHFGRTYFAYKRKVPRFLLF